MKLRCAAASDPGRVRTNNEDRVHCDPERGIFLVVDGVGGQAAGEQAAEIAVKMIRSRLERKTGTPEERLREAIAVANNEIVRLAATRQEWNGMACVLTAAIIEDGVVTIGHVGDSRLYKIRKSTIDKLTHDHSPVGEREDTRELSELEAMRHPRRNEVFRDVGSEMHTPEDADFVEIARAPFERDSAIVLCSDGLSDQVPSAEIRHIVERNAGDPRTAVRELIAAANLAGGKDNVTALLVEGERFAQRGANQSPVTSALLSRPAMFVYGAILAAALVWFLRPTPKPVTEGPRTLTVGAGAPFSSISSALAQAEAGDTVEVLPGEYSEQVRLKDGVLLKSVRPREAVLRASPGVRPAIAVIAERLQSGGLKGFRIVPSSEAPATLGLLIADSSIDVEDNEIASAQAGIEIRGASRPLVRANSIHDCIYQGIIVEAPAEPRIEHNVITRNGRGSGQPRPGISVMSDAAPILRGNVFAGNGAGAVSLPASGNMHAIGNDNLFLEKRTVTQSPEVSNGRPRR
ncbi:MAG TPA: protein phosphatase 2C domain-containing protein [Terriglobales bacterium]|nr:protein phosphatase 2C domain-containing protein [Terriglobales bacterium]